ncbi:MAG: AAA family ATPase, partial [Candidatus Nezhaarchaeales archaeon]
MLHISIKSFGPIKNAEIELAPLTIFIGKNSTGKSMLLYLIWTLLSTLPDFTLWDQEVAKRDEVNILRKIYDQLTKGEEVSSYIKEYIKLYLETYPQAYAKNLLNTLREAYKVDLKDLVMRGSEKAEVTLKSNNAALKIILNKNDVEAEWIKLHVDQTLNKLAIRSVGLSFITIEGKGWAVSKYISSLMDIVYLISKAMPHVLVDLIPLIPLPAPLLVDGRAGITRILISEYPITARLLKEALSPDIGFIETLYKLAKDYQEGKIEIKAKPLKNLLLELGFTPIIREELGKPKLYVETWTRQRLPLEK